MSSERFLRHSSLLPQEKNRDEEEPTTSPLPGGCQSEGESGQLLQVTDDIAIRVQNLSKCYQIYDQSHDRLKQSIYPRLQRFVGSPPKQYFREFWALKDVSFEVKQGEIVGIIGCNGSGKSTLLQMICGTLNPTSGSIQTCGRIAALLELGSGFNPEFTGRENVYMNAAVLGLSSEEIDSRFDEIAAFADIGEFIEQPIKSYSSGMVVRLAFAVAIHVTPNILVVDEALSVGDIRFQNKCLRKIGEIKESGSSILFVSHSSSQVEALCNRVVWLNDGVVKTIGSPADVVRKYINFMVHGLDEFDSKKDTKKAVLNDSNTVNVGEEELWVKIDAHYNRKINGEVDISKVRACLIDGRVLGRVVSAPQKIMIEMQINFGISVWRPLIAIGVFNSLNEPIVHFNSESIGEFVAPVIKPCVAIIRFTFTLPPLRPGEYLLSLGIDEGLQGSSEILCHVYDAWNFQVAAPTGGLVQGGYIQVTDPILEINFVSEN